MSEPIDISPSQRKELLTLIQRHLPNVEVWAFGSRVKWTARSNSDLDLVALAKPEDEGRISRLKEALEESSLPFRVDVLVWDNIPESFKKNIRERHVVLVEAEKSGQGRVMNFDTAKCVKPKSELIPLSDIANVVGGYAFKGSDFGNCGVPVVKIANIEPPRVNIQSCEKIPAEKLSGLDRFHLSKGDILMAMTGATVGKVGRILDYQAAYLNQRVAKISSKIAPDYDDFIFALLSQKGFEEKILNNSSGSAQANVSVDGIGKVLIPALEPRNQLKIGKFVAAIDDKIESNRRINQTLEAMAQAIFKSWFVDFEPVKAKIAAKQEGRDPLRAAMSAISGKADAELDALPPEQYAQLATTAALFPDAMEESELGEIPRGWALAALSTVCDLNAHNWSAKTLPESVKYVDLANTKNGEVIEIQTMEGSNIPSRARRILEAGDTIVGTVRPGNRSFALVGEAGLTGSTGFAVLSPKKSYLREYVYLAATADANIEHLAHLADGGAYPAVRPELVVTEALPIPREDLLREFHRISAPMFDQVLEMRRANCDLADLRDTLLPKLLSGELSVAEAMAEAEA